MPLEDARVRKFDVVKVWQMDCGSRSVMSAAATLLRPLDAQNSTPTVESD